jgi:hypothetical protein
MSTVNAGALEKVMLFDGRLAATQGGSLGVNATLAVAQLKQALGIDLTGLLKGGQAVAPAAPPSLPPKGGAKDRPGR